MVAVSGSLAHLYVLGTEGRLTRQEVEGLHPELVDGLVEHEHIGAVVTLLGNGDLAVEDAHGRIDLRPGDPGAEPVVGQVVHGRDPLEQYGGRAAADILDLSARADVGDVMVLAPHDEALGEVAAFEELVGSHGGLGGWQNQAFVLHPGAWVLPRETLSGVGLHHALLGRLAQLGLRAPALVPHDPVEMVP